MTGRKPSKIRALLGLIAAAACILVAVTFLRQDRCLAVAVAVVDRPIDGAPRGGHPVLLDSLYRLYQVAFTAFGVKGIADGEFDLAVD